MAYWPRQGSLTYICRGFSTEPTYPVTTIECIPLTALICCPSDAVHEMSYGFDHPFCPQVITGLPFFTSCKISVRFPLVRRRVPRYCVTPFCMASQKVPKLDTYPLCGLPTPRAP